jgi:hypothetical protein
MVKIPKPPPVLALILAVITSQLSTGIVYGWPALLPILEREGMYVELCNGTETCADRNTRFNAVYTSGITANICSYLLFGIILDKVGPLKTAIIGASMSGCGILLLGFATEYKFEGLIAAYILMGSGGVAVHLSSFHLGNMFPAWRSVVINLFSGIFNASCINFVFVLLIYQNGTSFFTLMLIYGSLVLAQIVSIIFFQHEKALPNTSRPPAVAPKSASGNCCLLWYRARIPDYTKMKSFWEQTRTLVFILTVVWIMFHFFRMSFYVGQLRYQLTSLGAVGNTYVLLATGLYGGSALLTVLVGQGD